MRNRRQTIESLRRLAERPGTKAEGEDHNIQGLGAYRDVYDADGEQ
jgi:hypothetical protein